MTPLRVRLRELRDEKGLSQQALGDKAGVRQATISDLESGKAKGVEFQTLEKLAAALGVEPGELLERDGKRPTRKR
jgi:putative transcriptional regulator